MIYVRQGKGRKDRYVMLPEQLLTILRDYYKRTHLPVTCVFHGQDREHNCDPIVMASHGRRGLGRLLLGSQAAKF